MSASESARSAAEHVVHLLLEEDTAVDELINRIAPEYEVKAEAVSAWLSRLFPRQEALSEHVSSVREGRAQASRIQLGLQPVIDAAEAEAQAIWTRCEPPSVEWANPINWGHCCERFIERENIEVVSQAAAARAVFDSASARFNAALRRYRRNGGREPFPSYRGRL